MAIVSHEHKFIFLKTTKTAGTSVEIALSHFCGPNDIVTPISGRDERYRREQGLVGPQHYRAPYRSYSGRDWARLIVRGRPKRLKNHSSAEVVRAFVGREVWDSYYKFCFDRNPWDRLVSLYHWRIRRLNFTPDFKEFVYATLSEDRATQKRYKAGGFFNWPMYCIDGAVAVDFIGRFESLNDDFRSVMQRLNLDWQSDLTHAKGGHRNTARDYRSYYDDELLEYTTKAFAWEIEHLGYRF